MNKIALITGAPGQDALVLAKQLLEKDYYVICTYRYSSTDFKKRFQYYPVSNHFKLEVCDIVDPSACVNIVKNYQPDELYNLAAASHVAESFNNPVSVFDVNTKGVVNLLEAIRHHSPQTKFCQASTSEMFGFNYYTKDGVKYQDETTPLSGNSPYAVSKIAAHNMVRLYRESYDLFACCSICFNHCSEYRGENFVTRKITKWAGDYYNTCKRFNCSVNDVIWSHDDYLVLSGGKFPKLRLGNVEAKRDWSYAGDVTRGMYLMLQKNNPDDYIFCSEKSRSVEEFLYEALSLIGINHYEQYVKIDSSFFRPIEVPYLQGRSTKAKQVLGWKPKCSFSSLIKRMVDFDCGNNY